MLKTLPRFSKTLPMTTFFLEKTLNLSLDEPQLQLKLKFTKST